MAPAPQPPIHSLAFDAYGTLFDVFAVGDAAKQIFGVHADAVLATWRSKQLEYTWLRALMNRYADFETVTVQALRYACRRHGLQCSREVERKLMEAYYRLAAFPEVPDVLVRLKKAGCRCVILSNGTPEMLNAAVRSAGLTPFLDAVLSAHQVQTYKPHPAVYQLAVEFFQQPADRIGFVSSNGFDVAGATSFGLQTFWINRNQTVAEELDLKPRFTGGNLQSVLETLQIP
ncbi:MAG: haloacid dehalogenase type II [Calditrichaeota bacterium]|nr:MAG: haloacid dehalogenase type II [Calditrichota bacterium]